MQTYSEIFWSDLYTSEKKKKAKQDRYYCSFLWQGLLTPSDRRYHCKLYKQPSHGYLQEFADPAQLPCLHPSSLLPSRGRPQPMTYLSYSSQVQQQSPANIGCSWLKKLTNCPAAFHNAFSSCTSQAGLPPAHGAGTTAGDDAAGSKGHRCAQSWCECSHHSGNQPLEAPAAPASFQNQERTTESV